MLPQLNDDGDLPAGVYQVTLNQALQRFGESSVRRRLLGDRLTRIVKVAWTTNQVARLIVFGSWVSSKEEPNDVDVFILMEDAFDAGALQSEAALLFDHAAADAHFGASVFWVRRLAAFGGEQATIEDWQIKRDGQRRGILDIVPESTS